MQEVLRRKSAAVSEATRSQQSKNPLKAICAPELHELRQALLDPGTLLDASVLQLLAIWTLSRVPR